MSLAEKGRAFMYAHPDCKPVDLVENCGFGLSYAKAFWYEEKRKVFNKKHLANRPKRELTKVKPPKVVVEKPAPKTVDWEGHYKGAVLHIEKLEKLITEHKAVIGYLERLIEKRYGSTV